MRRLIEINNFEELEHELDELESASEIETTGKWSFYQILLHISDSIHYSIHGYPGVLPWLIRKTIGRIVLGRLIAEGKMNPGHYNPTAPKEREEGDYKSAMSRLRECIKEFKNHDGIFSVHPIFDAMDKHTWEKLHCIHASLHMSFVHAKKNNHIKIDIDIPRQRTEERKEEKIEEVQKAPEKLAKVKTAKKKLSKKKTPLKAKKKSAKKKPASKSKKK
jgi:hypothetical protein